mgnify:FL=1
MDTQHETDSASHSTAVASESKKALSGLMAWYELNKQRVNIILGAVVVIVGGFSYYRLSYLPEQEMEAANAMYWAEDYFAKDSFNIALKGGINVFTPDGPKTMMGFNQVAESYSGTKTGNLASYYAGVCNLKLGRFKEAIACFEEYSNNDVLVASLAEGCTGDAYVELGQLEEGISHYLSAAKRANAFTSPMYLKKAAGIYELQGNFEKAMGLLERIQTEYHSSTEATDISKAIARIKAKQNS